MFRRALDLSWCLPLEVVLLLQKFFLLAGCPDKMICHVFLQGP